MHEYHIYLSCDHRGFKKKEELYPLLRDCHENVIVEDLGPDTYQKDDDYNDAALKVAQAVLNDEHSFGVLLCGSAHGVTMQANRVRGIRAINAASEESARIGRKEDYANVLCLAADELDVDTMEKIVKAFCHAREDQEMRYARRVERLDQDPMINFATAGSRDDDEEE